MSGAAFPLIKVSKASTSYSNILTNLLDASPCESHLVGAALRSFRFFSPTAVCAAPNQKPLQWNISLVSKRRLLLHQHPSKFYTLAIDEEILAQVSDSYN